MDLSQLYSFSALLVNYEQKYLNKEILSRPNNKNRISVDLVHQIEQNVNLGMENRVDYRCPLM